MPPEDNRLTDGAPMRPVSCQECGGRVLVRKSSWHQTSVQWSGDAVRGCTRRTASTTGSAAPGGFETCPALRATIREAALSGTLEVLDDDRTA
ncbi:ferredoxin [Streptomyces sp. NPDC055239]